MEQAKYTVFCQDGGYQDSDPEEVGCKLEEIIDWLANNGYSSPPVAWQHGLLRRESSVARAEAIAAGRTIELVDGKYIPRGFPVEEKKEELSGLAGLIRAQEECAVDEPTSYAEAIRQERAMYEPTSEPTRPALDWNKPTPFDAFKDYRVYSDPVSSGFVSPVAITAPLSTALPANPALSRMAGASHLFGSGWK